MQATMAEKSAFSASVMSLICSVACKSSGGLTSSTLNAIISTWPFGEKPTTDGQPPPVSSLPVLNIIIANLIMVRLMLMGRRVTPTRMVILQAVVSRVVV
jgi:hypothetical protein